MGLFFMGKHGSAFAAAKLRAVRSPDITQIPGLRHLQRSLTKTDRREKELRLRGRGLQELTSRGTDLD